MFLSFYSACSRLRLKCDGTRAETRFHLSAKRTSPFKSAGGRQFSRLLAAEVCASAVVMLDTPCSEVEYKTTGYPLHPSVSPSLPLTSATVCHHVSAVFPTNVRAITVRTVNCSLQQKLGNCSQPLKKYDLAPARFLFLQTWNSIIVKGR